MKKFSFIALFAMSTPAFAAPLLPQIQQTSRQIGQNAKKQQQAVVDAANAGKEHLEDEAVRNAQKLKDAVNSHADQLKADAKHDAVAAKQVLLEELACAVKSNATNKSISGVLNIDDQTKSKSLLLKIGSLLPDSPDFSQRKNLAVAFRLAADDVGNYQYQVVDLDQPAQSDQYVVHNVTLAQLGLDTDCSEHKSLVNVRDGIPQIDTDNVQKAIDDKSDVNKDVHAIEHELNKAVSQVQAAH